MRVDTFASSLTGSAVLYDTGIMSSGNHTITIAVTTQMRTEAEGAWVEVDALRVS